MGNRRTNHKDKNRITITLSRDTYETLKAFGEMGESFNDVVTKVLDKVAEIERAEKNN